MGRGILHRQHAAGSWEPGRLHPHRHGYRSRAGWTPISLTCLLIAPRYGEVLSLTAPCSMVRESEAHLWYHTP